MSKIKSLFLGPNAENLEQLRKLADDIILDAAFLRRNYQPDDPPLITERDKSEATYVDSVSQMRQELQSILADLKKSVPTYHPRHVGHMNADVFMTGITGFLGAMMYNPNNIINVASPSTTDMEVEYMNELCGMVGFDKISSQVSDDLSGSWGHLCSGGTSANIEALWVFRNLKYFPVSLKLAAKELSEAGEFEISSLGKKISDCPFKELFNLSPDEIYELVEKVAKSEKLSEEKNRDIFEKYTVQTLGVAGIHDKLRQQGENLAFPKVFVSQTHHYSWMKAMDILGLGRGNLVFVETDEDFRMDYNSLEKELAETGPVLAVVNIMGTTEEGAFDPLEKIINQRNENQQKFFVHVDGAYGGYFASLLCDGTDGESVTKYLNKVFKDEHCSGETPSWSEHFNFNDTWVQRVNALREADSITIDPHKLGYIPYPAGAILFKKCATRNMTRIEAPYVSNEETKKASTIHLGQWTLEGSRPGAAAVACCYSARVLPLDADNHGRLLACTVIGAAKLYQAIDKFNTDGKRNGGYSVIPLFKTDSNCVCYIITNKNLIKSPLLLNRFTKEVVKELEIDPRMRIIPDYKFIVSDSTWAYSSKKNKPGYKNNINAILKMAGIEESRRSEMEGHDFQYIRSVMMNPLAAYLPEGEHGTLFDDYMDCIKSILDRALAKVFSELVFEKNNNKRYRILWVENDKAVEEQKNKILSDPGFGLGLDIHFHDYNNDDAKSLLHIAHERGCDAIIMDLNLVDDNHLSLTDNRKIEKSLKIIREIKASHPDIDVIICSEYLSLSDNNKTLRNAILEELKKSKIPSADCLAKERINNTTLPPGEKSPLDFDKNKLTLAHRIFTLLQEKSTKKN